MENSKHYPLHPNATHKVLASFEPDMFQMLKYENALMNPPFKGGNK